ncbi:hypothetical protein COU36_02985 [Candidatus Micrarchaeota archaeon CG10_big_fil_rev_8_21_14_0_10_59_7]|nr:MAG: hypothetical protein COU36_02985 [Candidatus Micrarchaeota archaeon CG10_big_fil_rev_8_21_14_0_10_59_7]
MGKIIHLDLDVLKPNEPSIMDLSKNLLKCRGVKTVDVSVREMDRKVETVRVALDGNDMNFNEIRAAIEHTGAVIHSVDHVISGRRKK